MNGKCLFVGTSDIRETKYKYDGKNQLVAFTDPEGRKETYTYDSAGNQSAFAVKVGDDTKLSLKYTYDGESRLTSVTDEAGNEIAAYRYDTDGNLSQRTAAGAGLTTTYAYDYQNRLTDLKNQTGSAGVISQYTSEYLANGQKSKETSDVMDKDGKKTKKTAAYTYDLLGRITKETQTGR